MVPFNFYQIVFICLAFLLLIQCTNSKNINYEEAKANIAFNKWLSEYKSTAKKNLGVSEETLDQIFKNIRYNKDIISLDSRQVEFTVSADRYLNIVLTEETYTKGYDFLKNHLKDMSIIEEKYQVPAYVIAAFLGIETRYGTKKPQYNAAEAISNLAFNPRRSSFFTKELNSLVILINKGYISSEVKSSWAGALGYPQFMPSTYLYYGIDGNGDNNIDLVNNFKDTFASVANFLRSLGWNYYRDWGYEVILPDNFDESYIANKTKLPIYQWDNMGVKRVNNTKYSNISAQAKIILVDNKTYLVTSNFDVIMKWNKSTLFALAVGTLSDKLREYSITLQKSITPSESSLVNDKNKNVISKTHCKANKKNNNKKVIANKSNTKQKVLLNLNVKQQKIDNEKCITTKEWLFEEKRRISAGEEIK